MTNRHEPETDPVAVWLRRVAASEEAPTSLPTAGQILWKAEILQRLDDEDARVRRAARPAEWCRRLVGAVVFAAAVSFLFLTLGRVVGGGSWSVPGSWILIGSVLVPPLLATAGIAAILWRDA